MYVTALMVVTVFCPAKSTRTHWQPGWQPGLTAASVTLRVWLGRLGELEPWGSRARRSQLVSSPSESSVPGPLMTQVIRATSMPRPLIEPSNIFHLDKMHWPFRTNYQERDCIVVDCEES